MPAKKKTEPIVAPSNEAAKPEVAHSGTSSEVPKDAKPKRIEVGDWVMFASPLFVQLHLVAKPRSKENVVMACGLANPPDFSGRPNGPRCKRCTALHSDVVKPKVVKA